MTAFSFERGNLYESNTIRGAEETYKNKRDQVLDNIISEGKSVDVFAEREEFRQKLREKIKGGFIDREYLKRHHWPEDRVLMTEEMVDFLLPQIKTSEAPVFREAPEPVIKYIQDTILPTKNGEAPEAGNGAGIEEKTLIPRFEVLADFLKKSGINTDEYFCYAGINTPEMMRGQSYVMFILPTLNKMAMVCDEEGNATYIIHIAPTQEEFEKLKKDEKMEDNERNPKLYYNLSKQELRRLGEKLGVVSWVKWDDKNWLEVIEEELTKEFDGKFGKEDVLEVLKNFEEGEEEKKEFLSFEEAREKAREKGFQSGKDYNKRYKEVPGLPANPRRIYKDKGWINWIDFLGTNRVLQKPEQILPFEQAREKAREKGFQSVKDYNKRYKEAPGLPANPNKTYKNKGWKNWADFLGTDLVRQKPEQILPFEQAREKAREKGFQSIKDYNKRYKEVSGLPANPNRFYKNKGWTNWVDFLGKDK